MNSEEKDASRKDLYEKLWDARDFEIDHQWQRSVFLATFLVLLFTLFFTVLGQFLNTEHEATASQDFMLQYSSEDVTKLSMTSGMDATYEEGNSYKSEAFPYFLTLSIISFFGYSISILWICMARGSKYIYERIEIGINKTYKEFFFEPSIQNDLWIEKMRIISSDGFEEEIPRHGHLPEADFSYNLFSLRGGKYSLSKINILLGYFFILIWITLAISTWIIIPQFIKLATILITAMCVLIPPITISYLVLSSNNKLRFRDYPEYIIFSVKEKKAKRAEKRNHINWVTDFLSTSNALEVKDHVIGALTHYIHDNFMIDLLRQIETASANEKTCRKAALYILNNVNLNRVFEYSLMYREKFNNRFKGTWKSIINPDVQIKIKDNSFTMIKDNQVEYNNEVGDKIKLYADTDWNAIETKANFNIDEDETTYRIISLNEYKPVKMITLSLKEYPEKFLEFNIVENNGAGPQKANITVFKKQ